MNDYRTNHPATQRSSDLKSNLFTHRDSLRRPLTPVNLVLIILQNIRRLVLELHPHILLAPPQLRGIDSNKQAFYSALLGVLYQLSGHVPILVDVEL